MTMIATIGADLPLPVLQATGRLAGPLAWNIDRPFPRAGQWLESKFATWAFSVLEDWAQGALDGLEAVVFSRSDDSAQRLYYYVCELRRRGLLAGPEPLLFDIGFINRPTSEARTIASVRALAARFGVSDDAVEAALAAAPEPEAPSPDAPAPSAGPACLLAGSPPPDGRVHAMIAAAGFRAVGDSLRDLWSRPCPGVARGSGDPCAAIGRALHARQQGPRGFYDRGAALVDAVRAAGARAAILWFVEEDEARVWHLPAERRALAEAGIPALVLTRRSWRADDGLDAEIAAFLQELPA